MKANPSLTFLVLVMVLASCADSETNAQSQNTSLPRIGGQCEGCEAIYENKIPFAKLDWQLTLPGYDEKGPKLHITGTVYRADGKTPAAGTILYFYHTDQGGIYPPGNETGWGRRHGYIRGWLKTNDKGQYRIRTLKPGAYPDRGAPAHIHCIVKEDKLNEYYIGDFLFDDDPLLTKEDKSNKNIPGGSGILKPEKRNDILYAERNIYLGKDIRNYPVGFKHIKGLILTDMAIYTDEKIQTVR